MALLRTYCLRRIAGTASGHRSGTTVPSASTLSIPYLRPAVSKPVSAFAHWVEECRIRFRKLASGGNTAREKYPVQPIALQSCGFAPILHRKSPLAAQQRERLCERGSNSKRALDPRRPQTKRRLTERLTGTSACSGNIPKTNGTALPGPKECSGDPPPKSELPMKAQDLKK